MFPGKRLMKYLIISGYTVTKVYRGKYEILRKLNLSKYWEVKLIILIFAVEIESQSSEGFKNKN